MTSCQTGGWIGAPLRTAYAAAIDSPVSPTLDDLLMRIDDELTRRNFAAELATVMPRLRGYARSLARDDDRADDLVQDTLLRAWKARDQFAPGTSLRAWTCTILRNVFLSGRRRARFEGDYDEIVAEARLARPEDQTVTVELAHVRRAIEALVPEQRDALRLVSLEGLSYEEAAARAGTSLASFKSRVRRGRATLQAIVDGTSSPVLRPTDPPSRREAAVPPSGRGGRRNAWADAKASGRQLWIG